MKETVSAWSHPRASRLGCEKYCDDIFHEKWEGCHRFSRGGGGHGMVGPVGGAGADRVANSQLAVESILPSYLVKETVGRSDSETRFL